MAIEPQGDHMIKRFYLSTIAAIGPNAEPFKFEVPKDAWIFVERRAGFLGGREGEPTTGGFTGGGVRGSLDTRWTTVKVADAVTCANCSAPITLVNEQWLDHARDVDGAWRLGVEIRDLWRHDHDEFPLGLGPVECDLEIIRFEATPTES